MERVELGSTLANHVLSKESNTNKKLLKLQVIKCNLMKFLIKLSYKNRRRKKSVEEKSLWGEALRSTTVVKKRRGIIIHNIEKETKLEINWRIICASAIQENNMENRSRLMHLQLNFKF